MTTTAVIPIKQLTNAKQRLGGILDAQERAGFFRAMVEDVMTAAEACTAIDEIMVVTNDDNVADFAGSFGARVLPEPGESGLIAAVTYAASTLADEGCSTMVFLPGDIPMVSPEELEVVLDGFGSGDQAEVMLVPASDMGGSNCVVCSPPNTMTFGFGEDSFRRHLRLAREAGIEPSVARLPGIGLDVDTPADMLELVESLMQTNLDSHTARFVLASDLPDRLQQMAEQTG